MTLFIDASDDASVVGPEELAGVLKGGPAGEGLAWAAAVLGPSRDRFETLVDLFPNRSAVSPIAAQDWTDVWPIQPLFTSSVVIPCLTGDVDPEAPECVITDEVDGLETVIPACAEVVTRPCYRLDVDLVECAAFPSRLRVMVERDEYPPRGTWTIVRCGVSCG